MNKKKIVEQVIHHEVMDEVLRDEAHTLSTAEMVELINELLSGVDEDKIFYQKEIREIENGLGFSAAALMRMRMLLAKQYQDFKDRIYVDPAEVKEMPREEFSRTFEDLRYRKVHKDTIKAMAKRLYSKK